VPSLSDLHQYQLDARAWIEENPKGLLILDMGLGKTVVTLTALQDLYDTYQVNKVLIVAPKRVALTTWPAEIELWSHVSLGYEVLAKPKKEREEACKSGAPLHIINIDNLVWLIEHWGKDWPYDMVVVDESSLFKAYNTRRFKALKRQLSRIDRVVLLTGTPATRSLQDLWPQVFLLDQGERLFRTITGFRNHYMVKDYNGFSWSMRAGAEEEIYDKISDLCLRMKANDYLDTPERINVRVPVQLPKKAMDQYRELEKESLLQLTEEDVVTAGSAGVLVGKLLQAANGALYVEGEHRELHSAKVDALKDLVETSGGQPMLVAYYFKHDLARLREAFPQAEVLTDDPEVIRRWNDGEIELLLAHPQSAGHGLNLQRGGRVIVWFSLVWSLELYQQFNARLHRQGQKETVVVHHLVAEETVDEDVVAALAAKDEGQEALFQALKARAERVA